ncbi:MAG: molybdopterin-dependent oxidoreductase [Desulfosudis oleivorans]|nr:molybdopterin-dependent oxidoreductase [Desulfosudis oleivorans]
MFGPDGARTGDAGARTSLERREFLKLAGGGLVVFFAVGGGLDAQMGGARGADGGYPEDPNAYLQVGSNGRVTCFTGKIEMGQGIVTSLAMMLAEELDVAARRGGHGHGRHRPLPLRRRAPSARCSTQHLRPSPARRPRPRPAASSSELAAARFGAAEDTLLTKDGAVRVAQDPAKSATYAELVGGKRIEIRLEKKPPIKHHSRHTVSGRPTLRTRCPGQGHGRGRVLRRHPAAGHALCRDPAAAGPWRRPQERGHRRSREDPRRPGHPRRRSGRGAPREARPRGRGPSPRRGRVRALAVEARQRQHLRPHQGDRRPRRGGRRIGEPR